MKPPAWLWPALAALVIIAGYLIAALPTRRPVVQPVGMSTLSNSKKPTTGKLSMSPAAVRARRRRAEDKADYELAVKRLADLDSGKTKAIPAEEVWRELGI